ncbi:hypothetical protein [Alicyclobacillus pomorum]|jgi:hypothetical protein|uniref:hypothetical protein n=1 Tax=Alicyclobacillus pomorum TaxID=204470 RepID=UPI0003FBDEB2|nr:hypothetical protein [Alicyclobacillus pomorum]
MNWKAEQWVASVGLMFAASVLVPKLKTVAKPAISGGFTGASLAGNEVRKRFSLVREELEDFMAEVQFERFKKRIDSEMEVK